MAFESNLHSLLSGICPNTFPDLAPEGVTTPYVTWQTLGGEPARFLDGTAADKRNSYLQINVWTTTRAASLVLIRSIEDAMCASSLFIARPQGEAMNMHEPDTKLYGCIQRYNVWALR